MNYGCMVIDDAVMCTLHFDTNFTAYSNSNVILLCILFLIQYIYYHFHYRLC